MRRRSYRTRLELQVLQASTACDARGHSQRQFATVERVWASVAQIDADEVLLARERFPEATHRVEHDYTTRAHARARYKFPNIERYLPILGVDDVDHRGRTTVAICREEQSTGYAASTA